VARHAAALAAGALFAWLMSDAPGVSGAWLGLCFALGQGMVLDAWPRRK